MYGEPFWRMPVVVALLLHHLSVTGARAEGELSLTNGGLIAVWNMRNGGLSSLSLVGDADGTVALRGFCGSYGIEVDTDEAHAESAVSLAAKGETVLVRLARARPDAVAD